MQATKDWMLLGQFLENLGEVLSTGQLSDQRIEFESYDGIDRVLGAGLLVLK